MPPVPMALGVDDERDDVEDAARPQDEGHEAEVVAQAPQQRREAEQARARAAADEALLVADPDEGAAGGAEDRAGTGPVVHGEHLLYGAEVPGGRAASRSGREGSVR